MDPQAHECSHDTDGGRSSQEVQSSESRPHNDGQALRSRRSPDTMRPASQEQITILHTPNSPDVAPMRPPHSARTSDRRLYDPEKYSLPTSPYLPVANPDPYHMNRKHQEAVRLLKKDLGALVNFMFLTPFVSFAMAFYTLFALFVLLFLAPLNICISSRKPLSLQLRTLLVPATNLHYKCAWSSSCASTENIHRSWPGSVCSDTSDEELQLPLHKADAPKNSLLVTILLLSPPLSLPFVCAALVVALWWIMSAITANDVADGISEEQPRRERHGGFDEGQRLARGLRHWWIGWLSGDKLR